jgi:hypothetical protein
MVQTTDFADGHDLAHLRRLDRPSVWGILGESEMGPGVMVVPEIRSEDVSQVALAQDDDVVETVPPDRPDQAFGEGVLPGAVWRREDFTDSHTLHTLLKRVTVDAVAIAEEIGGGGVVREGVDDLLGSPGRGGMLGDVEMQDAPAMVSEHDEDKEHPQGRGGTVKKSIEPKARTWLVRKVRQV